MQEIGKMARRARGLLGRVAMSAAVLGGGAARAAHYAPVTDARLANAAQDNGWLMYRHDYGSSGFTKLNQITTANVAGLKQVWDYKTGFNQGHEAPAIVNGDAMFITTPKDELLAFQASTGKLLWKYDHAATSTWRRWTIIWWRWTR